MTETLLEKCERLEAEVKSLKCLCEAQHDRIVQLLKIKKCGENVLVHPSIDNYDGKDCFSGHED